jgi:hypothetical protein
MTKVPNPLEGSSFSARHVRVLKISIAIMTGLLILGVVALLYGMARQASRLGTVPKPAPVSASQPPYERTLNLGQGQLTGITISNELLILHWKSAGSDTILTIDVRDGHEIGRIQVPGH